MVHPTTTKQLLVYLLCLNNAKCAYSMTARPHLHQQDRCQKQNSRVIQTNVLKIQARQSLITLRTISAKVIIMKPRSRQNPALQEQANPFIKMKKNKIISLCMNRGTQNELACSCKVLLKLCINGNSAEIPCSWNTITFSSKTGS